MSKLTLDIGTIIEFYIGTLGSTRIGEVVGYGQYVKNPGGDGGKFEPGYCKENGGFYFVEADAKRHIIYPHEIACIRERRKDA